jgi:hypothetical protein
MSFVEADAPVESTEQEPTIVKKVRQPKLDENGTPIPKKVRAPKLDVDGNPIPKKVREPKLDADGNPIPKKVREPKLDENGNPIARAPRKVAVQYTVNGTSVSKVDLEAAKLEIVGDIASREGSNRAARMVAFVGAETVGDFRANKGVEKDLNRLALAGKIKLSLNGQPVEVSSKP